MEPMDKPKVEPLHLEIEVLEERIAPDTTGYEGQPGGQSHGGNHGDGGNTGYEGQPGNQSNG